MTLLRWHSCCTDRGSYYELGLQRCKLPGRLDRANPTLLDTSPAASDEALLAPFAGAYYRPETLTDTQRQRTLQWVGRYAGQVRAEGVPKHERRVRTQSVNPKFVRRNYLAQLAIDRAEQNDYELVNELLEVLRRSYDEQPDKETFAAKRPDWARQRPGCSMLSCSL
jgi:serine/tyrosine/threonine adenylyltransferase